MIKTTTVAAALAGLFVLSAPVAASAEESGNGFAFEKALKASFQVFRDTGTAIQSGIESALDGLTGDDGQDVSQTDEEMGEAFRVTAREMHQRQEMEMHQYGEKGEAEHGAEEGHDGHESGEAEGHDSEGHSGGSSGESEGRGGEGRGGEGRGGHA